VIEVDTPAVVVDLDRLDRNLERWQRHCDAVGLANRPHVKTHKSVEIARRQVALGARGITCQKLGEAEIMAEAGIDDVLIPYNLLGESKLRRLRALAVRAAMAVSVDDDRLLPGLAAAMRGGPELRVLVECDTGLGRVGVGTPEAAAALASAIARTDGLRWWLPHLPVARGSARVPR
jgi:D-serine deaminase-like pyridoxal phosphate-dependent protein